MAIREGDVEPGGANCMFRCPEWCGECAEQENARWVPHVTEEGSREHVKYYGQGFGIRCSTPNCEINRNEASG